MIHQLTAHQSHSLSPFGRPLRTLFLLTSMPIGGAETLLVNLVKQIDRNRIVPLVGCLKQPGVLGEQLATEIPLFHELLRHKYDVAAVHRLTRLFRNQKIDALVTVGAGDKMFWGRLGGKLAGLPVILSALHSTGWPDGIGRMNRALTGITDGFIAVAQQHADYQITTEKFPCNKVFLIPNGIDTDAFAFSAAGRQRWRRKLSIADNAPVVGIVAALRPEKNHDLFIEVARRVSSNFPQARFVIVGDGPERQRLQELATAKGIAARILFVGATQDIAGVLSMMDVFALTSDNEASPVSIMEALACQRPVVATDVGSIDETVLDEYTGLLVPPGDAQSMTQAWLRLIREPQMRSTLGLQGRDHVIHHCSLQSMAEGYMNLIETLFAVKTKSRRLPAAPPQTLPDGWVSWEYQQPGPDKPVGNQKRDAGESVATSQPVRLDSN